jgi:hypothetical protein
MKPWIFSRAFIALIILHTALSFPAQPNHGFGFHRRGPRRTFAGIVLARKQKETICRVAQENARTNRILISVACTATVCCVMVCGVVLQSVGKVTDGLGESVGKVTEILGGSVDKVNATVNARWSETNARWGETNNRIGAIGAPFTFLCWTVGIYLLSESGKVNRVQCVCPFFDNLAGF